jgi:hypothetical protein
MPKLYRKLKEALSRHVAPFLHGERKEHWATRVMLKLIDRITHRLDFVPHFNSELSVSS